MQEPDAQKPEKVHKKQNKSSHDDCQEQIDLLKGQLARVLADYDNLRKRTDEEKVTWISLASKRVVGKLLPLLDALELSQQHVKDPGLAIVLQEFRSLLKEEGLFEIKPDSGNDFDHEVMEAVDTVPTSDENMDGKVDAVSMSGWKFGDGTIVRHAKVTVFKK
jgi:molecular chaperone GrpE